MFLVEDGGTNGAQHRRMRDRNRMILRRRRAYRNMREPE